MNSPEEIWEKTMKEVIGEDGPESVADAIRRLQEDLSSERSKRRSLQLQNQGLMMNQKAAGLCISYALEGKSRPEDRWWMGEMDRVRDLAADRDALAARVERLRSDILSATSRTGPNGDYLILTVEFERLRNMADETKPAALARVRAEAVTEYAHSLTQFLTDVEQLEGDLPLEFCRGLGVAKDNALRLAQRLIDEAEGGG